MIIMQYKVDPFDGNPDFEIKHHLEFVWEPVTTNVRFRKRV